MKRTNKRLEIVRSTLQDLTPIRLEVVRGAAPAGCRNTRFTSYSSEYTQDGCNTEV
jgi:hypothetical protein